MRPLTGLLSELEGLGGVGVRLRPPAEQPVGAAAGEERERQHREQAVSPRARDDRARELAGMLHVLGPQQRLGQRGAHRSPQRGVGALEEPLGGPQQRLAGGGVAAQDAGGAERVGGDERQRRPGALPTRIRLLGEPLGLARLPAMIDASAASSSMATARGGSWGSTLAASSSS